MVVASHATDRRYPASAISAGADREGGTADQFRRRTGRPHGPKDLPVDDASKLDRYL